MTTEATLRFAVGVTATPPEDRLPFRVEIDSSSAEDLEFTVGVDGAAAAASAPAPGETQFVGLEILIDGVRLDPRWQIGSWRVSRSFTGASSTISLATLAELGVFVGHDPIGSPFGYFGAIPGKKLITINGVIVAGGTKTVIPLLTDGITDNSTRLTRGGIYTDTLNIADKLARHDRRLVTISLPPGHGLDRSTVVRKIMEAAGVVDFDLAPTRRMDKEVVLIDTPPFPAARELMDTSSRYLVFDRFGSLSNPEVIPSPGQRVDQVVDVAAISQAGGVDVAAAADVPTRVTLTSTLQVTQDSCGIRSETRLVENFAVYAQKFAVFTQFADGSLNPTFVVPPIPVLQLVSRITTTQTFDCDTLVQTRVVTEAWKNPVKARYQWDATGTNTTTTYPGNVKIYDSSAVKDDSSQGYAWTAERFVVVSDVITSHSYDDDTGFETEIKTRTKGWFARLAAVKTRANSTVAWTAVPFLANQLIFANQDGSADGIERFWEEGFGISGPSTSVSDQVETVTVLFDVDDSGFIGTETEELEKFFHKPGVRWLYNGGDESFQSDDLFELFSTKTKTNIASGEGNHVEVESETFTDGRQNITQTTETGHLPASGLRADPLPDPAQFPDGRAASRDQTQQIKSICEAPFLEATKEPSEIKASVPWAEDETELESLCLRMLREGAALRVTVQLAGCNFLLSEGKLVRLTVNKMGLNHLLWISDISWSQSGPKASITTAIQGDIFLF